MTRSRSRPSAYNSKVVPFKSESQRRWMYANDPEMAKEWSAHTPKGKKLPEHVKKSYFLGAAAALDRFGLKTAAEELRLKIPSRTFHGWDAAHKNEATREGKRAEAEPEANADSLAQIFTKLEVPKSPLAQDPAKDPLDRSTAWGAPSNLAAGDAGSRLSDMGQPTSIGTVF